MKLISWNINRRMLTSAVVSLRLHTFDWDSCVRSLSRYHTHRKYWLYISETNTQANWLNSKEEKCLFSSNVRMLTVAVTVLVARWNVEWYNLNRRYICTQHFVLCFEWSHITMMLSNEWCESARHIFDFVTSNMSCSSLLFLFCCWILKNRPSMLNYVCWLK